MLISSWTMVVGLALVAAEAPSATWLGQDGHDLADLGAEAPSEIQDIHIALSGLPPKRKIVNVMVIADGGNEWESNPRGRLFRAVLRRQPGSKTADLFFEPARKETGRRFSIILTYDNGEKVQVIVQGGKADREVRMPEVSLAVAWDGQGPYDMVGPGPCVGPDNFQDVRLTLSRLSPKADVKSAVLEGPDGLRWEFGTNPRGSANAELIRDPKDPRKAELYIAPGRDLTGLPLKLIVTYANGLADSAALRGGRCAAWMPMPRRPLPGLTPNAIAGRWLGQDGGPGAAPGDVHVALTGLPTGRVPAAAVLSDAIRGLWVYRADDRVRLEPGPYERPLGFRLGADRSRADLHFAPYRDETGTTLTLRLIFQGGETAVAQFAGGACDPSRRVAAPSPSEVVARPGDDLNDLANGFGTVKLAPGTYRLARPLVLNHPVTLTAEGPGATLLFEQGPGDPPWTAAIKVHAGRTTLDGFAVRFAGPVRWDPGVAHGPAVIGTTDNRDSGHNELKLGLAFTRLDLATPPAANPADWEEAPRLIRLADAEGGRIEGNTLRGGPVELFEGPWTVADNDYRGTVPGTFAPAAIGGHYTFDLVVRNNRARPVGPSGKTWRFLVLTQRGTNDRVENNTVEAIGPRDDDTIPWANAPEVILTESYHLRFEGRLSAISSDGRVVRIPRRIGQPTVMGDIVAVLSGPHAGTWRKIAQVIDPTTFLLDAPLPRGSETISIGTGFVNETFEGNTVDSRGGGKADNLVLPGNHYGTKIRNNRLIGGREAFRLVAYATESPGPFGWSHVPFFGGLIEGNTIEDSEAGGILGVDHGPNTKSNHGRTYMVLTLRNTTFRWTEAFVSRHLQGSGTAIPPGLIIGYRPSLDPGELVVTEQADRHDAPSVAPRLAVVLVHAAIYNGREVINQGFTLPRAAAVGPGWTGDKK
ncbi:MAG: hypothetical protein JO252_19425 [Planctomycetaceae bacterium]|nr:hypothetical protein [Planctomycetaceae bacterium]